MFCNQQLHICSGLARQSSRVSWDLAHRGIMDLEEYSTVTKWEDRSTEKAGQTRGWGTWRSNAGKLGCIIVALYTSVTSWCIPPTQQEELTFEQTEGSWELRNDLRSGSKQSGNQNLKTTPSRTTNFLCFSSFLPCYFLFLFKNHLARTMTEQRERERSCLLEVENSTPVGIISLHWIGMGDTFSWMDPKCHCYQSCTLKKTAGNVPGKVGSLSQENITLPFTDPPFPLHQHVSSMAICWQVTLIGTQGRLQHKRNMPLLPVAVGPAHPTLITMPPGSGGITVTTTIVTGLNPARVPVH